MLVARVKELEMQGNVSSIIIHTSTTSFQAQATDLTQHHVHTTTSFCNAKFNTLQGKSQEVQPVQRPAHLSQECEFVQ